MKATKFGLFTVGALALSGGLAIYPWKNTNQHPPAPAVKPVPSPTLSENAGAPTTPTPTNAPPREENKGVSDSSLDEPVRPERKDDSIVAIPVRPEFDSVFRMSSGASMIHSKLEQQSRDSSWAPESEDSLRKWLEGKPAYSNYGTSSEIDCRTSICELRLIAYGAGKSEEFYKLLRTQPSSFWPDGGSLILLTGDEHDGRTTVLIQLAFPKRPGFKL